MRKTTVYLSDDEIEGLRALAARTGRSMADLIREGVRSLIKRPPKRRFNSMGAGESGGRFDGYEVDAEDLFRHSMGLE